MNIIIVPSFIRCCHLVLSVEYSLSCLTNLQNFLDISKCSNNYFRFFYTIFRRVIYTYYPVPNDHFNLTASLLFLFLVITVFLSFYFIDVVK